MRCDLGSASRVVASGRYAAQRQQGCKNDHTSMSVGERELERIERRQTLIGPRLPLWLPAGIAHPRYSRTGKKSK